MHFPRLSDPGEITELVHKRAKVMANALSNPSLARGLGDGAPVISLISVTDLRTSDGLPIRKSVESVSPPPSAPGSDRYPDMLRWVINQVKPSILAMNVFFVMNDEPEKLYLMVLLGDMAGETYRCAIEFYAEDGGLKDPVDPIEIKEGGKFWALSEDAFECFKIAHEWMQEAHLLAAPPTKPN